MTEEPLTTLGSQPVPRSWPETARPSLLVRNTEIAAHGLPHPPATAATHTNLADWPPSPRRSPMTTQRTGDDRAPPNGRPRHGSVPRTITSPGGPGGRCHHNGSRSGAATTGPPTVPPPGRHPALDLPRTWAGTSSHPLAAR